MTRIYSDPEWLKTAKEALDALEDEPRYVPRFDDPIDSRAAIARWLKKHDRSQVSNTFSGKENPLSVPDVVKVCALLRIPLPPEIELEDYEFAYWGWRLRLCDQSGADDALRELRLAATAGEQRRDAVRAVKRLVPGAKKTAKKGSGA